MKRTLENVPVSVDLETDGEVWCTVPLDESVRRFILGRAIKERQSIDVATERVMLRAIRDRIRRHRAEA